MKGAGISLLLFLQNKIKKTLEKILHIHYNNRVHATMAQLVEQRIRNAQAVG